MVNGKSGQRLEEKERGAGSEVHVGHTRHKSTRCMSACPSRCDSPLSDVVHDGHHHDRLGLFPGCRYFIMIRC